MTWIIPADPNDPEDQPMEIYQEDGIVVIGVDDTEFTVPYQEVPLLITALAVSADQARRHSLHIEGDEYA